MLSDVPRYQKPERRYIRMLLGTKTRNEGTFAKTTLFKVPEGHHPRGTTLREALRGNLPLRGLCGGLSEGSAGSLRGFCGGLCGVLRGSAGFSEVFGGSDPMLVTLRNCWNPFTKPPFCFLSNYSSNCRETMHRSLRAPEYRPWPGPKRIPYHLFCVLFICANTRGRQTCNNYRAKWFGHFLLFFFTLLRKGLISRDSPGGKSVKKCEEV